MIRKVGFGFVLVTALIVAACGRQVTPNPPGIGAGGLSPGYMSVKFDVAGTLDFTTYRYFIVFNTTDNGVTPLTNPIQTNWKGYSYAIEVGGNGSAVSATAYEYLQPNCTCTPAYLPLITTPQQLQFNPNSNGSGSEFTVIFQRSIFNGYTTTPTPSAGPTAGATPTPNPNGTPTPAPITQNWRFNAFTTQPNVNAVLTYVDSLGAGGPTDTTFVSPVLNVNSSFDNVYYALSSGLQIDPPAQITSIEIANSP